MIAVGGVIVNDALVLLDRYNILRRGDEMLPAIAAASAAARHRFRAVLLTSLTTVFGLSPLLYERSDELVFLVPFVVSMLGGLVFSTVFVLFFPADAGDDGRRSPGIALPLSGTAFPTARRSFVPMTIRSGLTINSVAPVLIATVLISSGANAQQLTLDEYRVWADTWLRGEVNELWITDVEPTGFSYAVVGARQASQPQPGSSRGRTCVLSRTARREIRGEWRHIRAAYRRERPA